MTSFEIMQGNLNLNSSDLIPSSRKSVQFSTVEIREYPIILGDNPCTSGPPITIDWKHSSQTKLDLDLHRKLNPLQRHKSELAIPSMFRHIILCNAGFSDFDIEQAMDTASLIRTQRIDSMKSPRMSRIRELKNVASKFKRIVSTRRKKIGADHTKVFQRTMITLR